MPPTSLLKCYYVNPIVLPLDCRTLFRRLGNGAYCYRIGRNVKFCFYPFASITFEANAVKSENLAYYEYCIYSQLNREETKKKIAIILGSKRSQDNIILFVG